jgi:hypothetical protein
VQRHGLGILFAALATAIAAIAAYALASGSGARHVLIGLAAASVALWLASLSASAFRRGRR